MNDRLANVREVDEELELQFGLRIASEGMGDMETRTKKRR